ncbi:unnamed protein product [Rotaria sp. Silwood2]|nr:unnamed protein product [Rotaria sp. Silwood2]CAF3991405.1 unnamed protein product [Rotaria sp. Silwood2]CAF4066192.1 unnamed protein product [Rotaria sp. Silwood2]
MEPLQEKPDEIKVNTPSCITFFIFILILSIIPLVAITIGIHYQSKCPINRFIPICLIVLGSSSLGLVLFSDLFFLNLALSKFPGDSNSTRINQTERYYKPITDLVRNQSARILGSFINRQPRRIDTHHHIVPEFYAQAVQETGGDPSGWPTPKWYPQLAKRSMSLLGVELAIVSITAPGTKIYEGNKEKGRVLARKLNEYSADLVKNNTGKFGFFASLPSLIDVEGTIAEIDYAHSILKADGFTLFTSYDHGKYLGHSLFQPIWAKLSEINPVVFIHPSEAPTTKVNCYMPQPLVDYPHETTRTVADLVLSGTRAAFPNINIILSHAGGTLPFLAQRIAGAGFIRSLSCPRGPRQILSDLRSFYFDTALSSSVPQLKALLEFADHSKIVFGSDIPYASLPVSLYMTKCLDAFFNKNYNTTKRKDLWHNINRNNAKALFPHKIKD